MSLFNNSSFHCFFKTSCIDENIIIEKEMATIMAVQADTYNKKGFKMN